MPDKPITQAITSGSDLRKNVPVVTVDSFYQAHGQKLQLKLEGKRVGFHRKIREPTINRPGLALSGFYNYFARKARAGPRRGGAVVLEESPAAESASCASAPCARKRFRAWSRPAALISTPSFWRWRKSNRWPFSGRRW